MKQTFKDLIGVKHTYDNNKITGTYKFKLNVFCNTKIRRTPSNVCNSQQDALKSHLLCVLLHLDYNCKSS